MRISIVTACFNAVDTIEATIKSVLDQSYEDIEYIVVDAGSTDGTREIIEKFSDRIAVRIFEPDGGQYFGIEKGLRASSGEVQCWLNADDILLPEAIRTVAEVFSQNKEVRWLTGRPAYLSENGQLTSMGGNAAGYSRYLICRGLYNRKFLGYLQQENMFWRRGLLNEVNGLNLEFKLAADFALWVEFAAHADLHLVNRPLAAFRVRPGVQRSSLMQDQYESEVFQCLSPGVAGLYRVFPNSRVLSALIRLLTFQRSPIHVFSSRKSKWVMRRSWRSASRASFGDLLLQLGGD